jgi:hypothetical protein
VVGHCQARLVRGDADGGAGVAFGLGRFLRAQSGDAVVVRADNFGRDVLQRALDVQPTLIGIAVSIDTAVVGQIVPAQNHGTADALSER